MLDDETDPNQSSRREDSRLSYTNARAGLPVHWRGEVVEQSLTQATTGRKTEPKMGSVFQRGVSPVQNFRFLETSSRNSTANVPIQLVSLATVLWLR